MKPLSFLLQSSDKVQPVRLERYEPSFVEKHEQIVSILFILGLMVLGLAAYFILFGNIGSYNNWEDNLWRWT